MQKCEQESTDWLSGFCAYNCQLLKFKGVKKNIGQAKLLSALKVLEAPVHLSESLEL